MWHSTHVPYGGLGDANKHAALVVTVGFANRKPLHSPVASSGHPAHKELGMWIKESPDETRSIYTQPHRLIW